MFKWKLLTVKGAQKGARFQISILIGDWQGGGVGGKKTFPSFFAASYYHVEARHSLPLQVVDDIRDGGNIGSNFIARHVKIRHACVLENSAGWFSLFPQMENVGYFGDILKGSLCLFAENTLKKKKKKSTHFPARLQFADVQHTTNTSAFKQTRFADESE